MEVRRRSATGRLRGVSMASSDIPSVYWYRAANRPNLGDEVTRLLLERRYDLPFRHVKDVDEADFVGVGSNLNQVFGRAQSRDRTAPLSVVGAGFMHPYLRVPTLPSVTVHSVRGHLSRALLPEAIGDVRLGDPGILASDMVLSRGEKKFDIGFIPHISRIADTELSASVAALGGQVTVIDFRTDDIDAALLRMSECRMIISQSLHGLIFADSLQLPNAWLYDKALHAGGAFKFHDYFSSVRRPFDLFVDPTSSLSARDVDRALFSIDAHVLQSVKDEVDGAFADVFASEASPWAGPGPRSSLVVEDRRVALSTASWRRTPRRPVELRQTDFDEKFDDDSLFFAVYEEDDGIRLDGPPLWNLRDVVAEAGWMADGSHIDPSRIKLRDRGHAQDSQIVAKASTLHVELGGDVFDIDVGPSYLDLFEGRRVIYTKSKNNDLRWIKEWATFYHSEHGVDGVLLYDNGSDSYTAQEVLDALADVPGIEAVAVVSWPFKFGPQAGARGKFDSDFFEYVVGSNAQHRFLGRAASVTHCDIDELVMTDDGRPIHEHLEESAKGYLRYWGRVVNGHLREPVADGATVSFENFGYYDPAKEPSTLKWSCIPGRLDPSVQWRTHAIDGVSVLATSHVLHRHFHAVSTGWKFPRNQAVGRVPEGLAIDTSLVAAMQRAGIAVDSGDEDPSE